MASSSEHIAAARRYLGDLARLQQQADAADKAIRAAAESRLRAVNADLDRLRARSITDDEAGDEYQTLVGERGQLMAVLAGLDMDQQE